MLVTDRRRTRGRPLPAQVVEAVEGGVGIVQVREKDLSPDALRALLVDLRTAVAAAGTHDVTWIVNGAAELAVAEGVGLHLPANEPRPAVVPAGPCGRSAHDDAEARHAVDEGADYLVLGTVYPTDSKPGHPGAGLAPLKRICRNVAPMPVFAIGGITVSRVPEVIHAGAWGIAVCGAILGSNHPRRIAEALSLALHVATGEDP